MTDMGKASIYLLGKVDCLHLNSNGEYIYPHVMDMAEKRHVDGIINSCSIDNWT